jgi:hypothetical protein
MPYMNAEYYLPTIINNPREHKNPEANLPNDNKLLQKRSYAFITDLFIIGVINKCLMYTYISFLKTYFYQLTLKTQLSLEAKMYDAHFVSLVIVFWGYFIMSYYWGEGKTPGKHIFGLKVHSPNFKNTGEFHLSLRESFARTLGYFINCLTFGSLFAISFITKSCNGFPDWLSQTSIVSDDQMKYIDEVYFSPDFKNDFLQAVNSSNDSKEIQLSLFDQKNEVTEGSVIELPPPENDHKDDDGSEAA